MKNYSQLMAQTLMNRYPDPDSYPYRSWSYPQGFMLWGFIRLYEQTGDISCRDYVLKYCSGHVDASGNISGFSGCSLDDIMAGSVLVWAHHVTGEERYRLACQTIRRCFDDYPRNPDGCFWHGRNLPGEMWIDGLFMGQMFLVRYGIEFGDEEYCFGEAAHQLEAAYASCQKDGTGLLYHAYSEDRRPAWAHRITGTSHEVWSEGLGWYAMILADVLCLTPRSHPAWTRLSGQLERLLRGLALVQDPVNGLWHQVVDKPGHPRNFQDTSGSAMFLYAFQTAAEHNLVDRELYREVIQRAFTGLKARCIPDMEGNAVIMEACDGLGVQVDYDAYVDFLRMANAKEAVAAFFWAVVAVEYGK